MITPVYAFLPQMDQKKDWPPQKKPQNDEYVFCQLINKNIFPRTAIKKRTIRRDKKKSIRRFE
jgi:hypothetical protein